jgi:DNA-directed RNA polymerase specialized sigma24 family protein
MSSVKEAHRRLNEIIEEVYQDCLDYCAAVKFKGSKQMYGQSPEDVTQEAVMQVLCHFSNTIEKNELEQFVKFKMNKSYVHAAISRNIDSKIWHICRNHSIESKQQPEVKQQFYDPDDEVGLDDIERVEIRQLMDQLGPKSKAFIRMYAKDGDTIRDVMRRLDHTNPRQFYKVRDNIQDFLERSGYDYEPSGRSKTTI